MMFTVDVIDKGRKVSFCLLGFVYLGVFYDFGNSATQRFFRNVGAVSNAVIMPNMCFHCGGSSYQWSRCC